MATIKLLSLDATAFDMLASKTRMRDEPKAMARSVLVDGKLPHEAALDFSVTKQRAASVVQTIRTMYSRTVLGDGTVGLEIQVELPAALVPSMVELLSALENLQTGHCGAEKELMRLSVEMARTGQLLRE